MLNKSKPAARAIGTAPVARATDSNGVTVVELVRGRVYFFKNIEFRIGEPIVLDDHVPEGVADKKAWINSVADEMEELHHIVTDADREQFEKPLFSVERGASRPNTKDAERAAAPKRTRLPVRPLPRH